MQLVTSCLLILALCAYAAGQCHTPNAGAVGDVAKLSADVCVINDVLKRSPPDYTTARAVYEGGRNSKSPTLKGVATAGYSTGLWGRFSSFFQNGVWLDSTISAALDGAPPYTNDPKRVKVITKTLQGGVLVQEVAFHLEEAIKKAGNGNKGGAQNSWDRAMAAYYGTDPDCAPFGNGQSRGIEFATINNGISFTNVNIGNEFGKGARILSGTINVPRLRSIQGEILRNIYIIYLQSILKYASLVEQAVDNGQDFDEDQAEGFGYARAVLPLISSVNRGVAQDVQNLFNLRQRPTKEKAAKVTRNLPSAYGGLGIGRDEVNNFDGSRKGRFQQPGNLGCQATNPFAGSISVSNTDADR